MRQTIGSFVFEPHIPGGGPVFVLTTWLIGRGEYGRYKLAYRLSMSSSNGSDVVLFEGEDYSCAVAPDSNEAVEGLMGFLTLKPGDTDEDYFAKYTPEQLDYCRRYAEALSCEVQARYGF